MVYSILLAFIFDASITDEYTVKTLIWADSIISFIFLLEILLRMIAMGTMCNKNAYLRYPINQIDFIIGVSVIFDFSMELYYLTVMKDQKDHKYLEVILSLLQVAKISRTLRPLRLVKA